MHGGTVKIGTDTRCAEAPRAGRTLRDAAVQVLKDFLMEQRGILTRIASEAQGQPDGVGTMLDENSVYVDTIAEHVDPSIVESNNNLVSILNIVPIELLIAQNTKYRPAWIY